MRPNLIAVLVMGFATVGISALAEQPVEAPLSALPYTPSLDLAAMDPAANACEDFYQYACGGWMRRNPIPDDQTSWSVYGKLYDENQRYLWGILSALSQSTKATGDQRKLGDYFAACMDEPAIEARGSQPLAPALKRIDAMQSIDDLPIVLATLQLTSDDDGFLFAFGAGQDLDDATRVIAGIDRGGLGLPDRDYYFSTDAKSQQLRAAYRDHVQAVFGLLGDSAKVSARNADRVLQLETALATAQLGLVDRRDPYRLRHKVDAKGLQALTPHFSWSRYLQALGHPQLAEFNVAEPTYLRAFDALLVPARLEDWKTYLRWQLSRIQAPLLSQAFVEADFNFYRKTLRGVPQLAARWKRCVDLTDAQLGEALGREFVERSFSPELKQNTLKMAKQIEDAMSAELASLEWMSPQTKQRAHEKLATIVNKIGYPDRWRDYDRYKVERADFFGNVARGHAFEGERRLATIGKPVDRGEWGMTPPTVNAYYDAQMNDINCPAGVLPPPLYDARMDAAPNYGNTGATIGHELPHGIDDEGRQFDAKGNLRDWWTPKDSKAFEQRAQCVIDQYAQYTVIDELKINSELTAGEDIADLGGLVLAWIAWQAETMNQRLAPVDGLTPAQRFFVGYAQWACENDRPENLRLHTQTDPHSPGRYRVNGLMPNMPEFAAAFSCKAGQAMVKEKPCKIW